MHLSVFRTTSQQEKRQHTKGHKRIQKVTEETGESEEEETDIEDPLFKIEEVSRVKTSGKQFNANITFSEQEELYFIELQCQLDTSATCNVMGLREFAVINQTGNPLLRSS